MTTNDRDDNGRFALGNPGGPGQPRRAIERQYLATLGEAVTLDDWREVVMQALTTAKAGDATARAWLAKYLVGLVPPTLLDLAAAEEEDRSVESEIREHATEQRMHRERSNRMDSLFDGIAGQ